MSLHTVIDYVPIPAALCESSEYTGTGGTIATGIPSCNNANVTAQRTFENVVTGNPAFAPYVAYMDDLRKAQYAEVLQAFTMALYAMGVAANILLLVYLVKFKRYRSPIFALICSLACCDLGVCLNGMIFPPILTPTLTGPSWLCAFYICSISLFYASSVQHMVFFSLLRFYQLVFPLAARAKVTVGIISKICLCIWINTAVIIFNFAPNYYSSYRFDYRGEFIIICAFDMTDKYTLVLVESLYLLAPNVLIAGFHIVKHFVVKRQAHKGLSDHNDGQLQQQRQTTDGRAVTIVIAVFCATSIPQLVHTFIHYVFDYPLQPYHQLLAMLTQTLEFGNSAINPWIYVFCAASIRRDIFSMLSCKSMLSGTDQH